MKPTKTNCFLLLSIFLMPFVSMAQNKTSRVKIFAPEDIEARASLLGLLEIDHFITDKDGGLVSEIDETEMLKLKSTGYQYEVLVPDVVKELDSLNKIYYSEVANNVRTRVALEQPGITSGTFIQAPAAFQVKGTFGGYYSFVEMEAAMDALVAAYPAIASKTSIGTTIEGRNIWVIKISDNVATDEANEPELLYMGLQHCREAIGGASMIFFMQYLCEQYGNPTDTKIKDLVDNREIYIIPCFNPDGWEYNRTSMGGGPGGVWRKNRRPNAGGTFGVDLNRNWGIDWGNCGAPIQGPPASCGTSTTSSDTYWGTAAFSENETQAVRNFTKAHNLVAGFDQHSVGPYYSLPFGRAALHTMGTKGTQFYTAVPALMGTYNGMRAANSYDALGYEVAGGYKDWMLMGEIGTSIGSGLKDSVWAMTGEGAAGGAGGFWAPAAQIINLSKSMCYQNLQLAFAAGSYYDIEDVNDIGLTSLTGNVDFRIQRLGLTNGPVTVSLIPLENIQSVGAPVTIGGLIYYGTATGSISYTLKPSLVAGQRVRYKWRVTTGGQTYEETVVKFLNPITVFSDDMEGSFATNWSNPVGSTATWVYAAGRGYNSLNGLSTNNAGVKYTANQTRICLYKNTFNLVGATAAYLTFWQKHRIENFNDKCQVQASTDGSTWVAVRGSNTIQEPGTLDGSTINGNPSFTGIRDYWTPEVFDLDAFRGNASVSLRFVFTSDNDASSFKFEIDSGMYIDNLKMIKSNTALIVLPVNFTSFNGTLQNNETVRLDWTAIVDQEHDYFVVERSADGINYTSLGLGPQTSPYQFIDQDPKQGNNYYRIRQVDKDGSIAYSTVINVVVEAKLIVEVFPNPIKDIMHIRFTDKKDQHLNLEISDVQGRVLYSRSYVASQNAVMNIDMKNFKPQVYVLKVSDADGKIWMTQKVIKR